MRFWQQHLYRECDVHPLRLPFEIDGITESFSSLLNPGFVHPGVNFAKRESPIILELDKNEDWDDNLNTEALMKPPLDRGPLPWHKRHKVGERNRFQ